MNNGLYVVATPIGNLDDISKRALEVLTQADVIACEDTRVTRKLFALLSLDANKPFITYQDHNEEQQAQKLIDLINEGKSLALVSDAGSPLISDPGYKLVRKCREQGVKVWTVPGCCAVISALQLSGLPTNRFMFAGFIPNKEKAREDLFKELCLLNSTLVFYETAQRIVKTLNVAQKYFQNREIAVAREITKLYEGDVITHDIYAGVENNESRNDNILLISSQNTQNNGTRFWEENKGRYLTEGDKKIVAMRILEKQMEAQRVNKQKIREANLQVLDKAFRLEDAKRANGKDFDAQSINPISRKEQKIHRIVAKFIQDNFMYRPFKAFDMKQKFNVTDKELKSLGLVITKAQLDDLFNRYAEFILPKYNGRIAGTEATYFSKKENQEKISAMFKDNAFNERAFPTVQPKQDELEMLENLEKNTLLVQQKILARKNSYYHNKQQMSKIINTLDIGR